MASYLNALDAITEKRKAELELLQAALGHQFQRLELLELALTHSSHSNRQGGSANNYEGLEFLGDSVLGLVISECLYRSHPGRPEGELSKMKGFLVSRNQLHRLSAEIGLGHYMVLGRGEEKTGGRKKKAILADVFESVVAAIYLDGGLEVARTFLHDRFHALLDQLLRSEIEFKDHKSRLQELLHARNAEGPIYRIAEAAGPDHNKEFLVEVHIAGQAVARGRGKSKKDAEQRAAAEALLLLEPEP